MLLVTHSLPPKTLQIVSISGCISPIQTSLSLFMPSQRYSCILRCTVYAPTFQISSSLLSLQENSPIYGISRYSNAPFRESISISASSASIFANRKPVCPIRKVDIKPYFPVMSRILWSFTKFFSPLLPIASATLSPNTVLIDAFFIAVFPSASKYRTVTLIPPAISVPKSKIIYPPLCKTAYSGSPPRTAC